MQILHQLIKEFQLNRLQAENTIRLIDEDNTIPFIARYRKEMTGGLSDVTLREFHERLNYLRSLEERKEEVIRLIEEQGKLTEELKKEILSAEVLQRVEDLYRPYRQKRRTRAMRAKEKGLEPLAESILEEKVLQGSIEELVQPFLNEAQEVCTIEDALAGAKDIIAEKISDHAAYREWIRKRYFDKGIIESQAVDADVHSVYEMYYEYREAVKKIADHRVLAINRGEREKLLRVKIVVSDEEVLSYLSKQMIQNPKAITTSYLAEAVEDGYRRLIQPSIEREVRNALTERAEENAIKVFAQNTKPLLLQPPVKDVRVLAIDPGYRTGCKLAVLDEIGKLLDYGTIYPHAPQNQIKESQKMMKEWILRYDIDVIAIGNGTASRETETVTAEMLKELDKEVSYTIVSEAGASVYSASKLAAEEYPDIDVSVRGAISIGRRLQDPLAELVKIDPKSIGVGQYQHDLNQGRLGESLKGVVEDCVNHVGVDLNTASSALLQYVSGITPAVGKNIVAYREENGKFTSRTQLKKVKRLGEKAFEQCAGFLRISDGDDPLDYTSVHPESYRTTMKLVEILGFDAEDIRQGKLRDIDQRMQQYTAQSNDSNHSSYEMCLMQIAKELGAGLPTLKDIIQELKKPGRDPRDEMPKPIFRMDVLKMEDLKLEMNLMGTVRNVVDFGAFVDIGVKQDGLVHISEMSEKYVKHPMDVVSVGDIVRVRIIGLDIERNKIALSMKEQ